MANKGTKSPESLPKLVRGTLGDLAVIRQSLVTAAGEPEDPNQPANSLLDLELAAELKSVVDELRRLLWAYVQALSAKSGRRPDEVLEWYKMELAVDMLRKARSRPSEPLPNQIAGHHTFEDLVTQALAVTAAHTEVHSLEFSVEQSAKPRGSTRFRSLATPVKLTGTKLSTNH